MITLHFDGSCLPTNPGYTAGLGAIIEGPGISKKKLSEKIDSSELISNNLAEYAALTMGLHYLLQQNLQNELITVYGDSKLVINQCSGRYKRQPRGLYANAADKCYRVLVLFPRIEFYWIPREQNCEADALTQIDCESAPLIDSVDYLDREYHLVCA